MQHLTRLIHRQSPRARLIVAAALLAAVALLDFATPLSVEILYLIPISLATAAAGRGGGITYVVGSGGLLLLTDLTSQRYVDPHLPLWNTLITSGIFLLFTYVLAWALALARERLQQEQTRAALLARTDALKTELLQAVSHDVRTPLAAIKTAVTILLDPTGVWPPGTPRTLLDGINDQCDRLNRLVGQLLDVSRIDGGMLHLDQDWYSLDEVIQTVLDQLQLVLATHPVHVHSPPDLPLVWLDFTRIEQVLTNLLENAAKYTPPGTPINVRGQVTAGGVAVSVIDGGPGATPPDAAGLFLPFTPHPVPGRPLGTGLGLSIAKGIVQAHGGRIRADRATDGGWCVCFTLPPGPPPPASSGPATAGRSCDD